MRQAGKFDFTSVLDVYMRDYAVPEQFAIGQLRELIRYLVACRVFEGEHLGMKGPVDHLWHSFIICTRQYTEFCSSLGGDYIHHDPCFVGGGGTSAYTHFRQRYRDLFCEEPPAEHWPASDLEPIRLASSWARQFQTP
jgi:hypothetical protein